MADAQPSYPPRDDAPKAKKRSRVVDSSTDNFEDSEPEEKRVTFKLQPPTLIHGQAKSVPKCVGEDGQSNAADSTSKCKFLQPSKLVVPSTVASTTPQSTVITTGNVVSSSNPFLHLVADESTNEESEGSVSTTVTNDNKENETETEKENGDPEKAEQVGKLNGNSDEPDSTTDSTSKSKDEPENLFLKANEPELSETKKSNGADFVFGCKMEDRVSIPESKRVDQESGDASSSTTQSPPQFVFGQNLAERAKVSSSTDSTQNSSTLFQVIPTSSEADSSTNPPNDQKNSEDVKRGLEESAAAHFLASQTRTVAPEVTVVTGEEDEKNVLQMQCKLYQYDVESQNWLERGVGSLHLNDGKSDDNDLQFTSRLVMRVHGSLRLVLNTKIWAQMTTERASTKSIRITAQTEDGKIGIFLITATINDAEQIQRALEYRILHQKQLQIKREEEKNKKEPNSNGETSKKEG